MVIFLKILFCITFCVVFYSYIGYALFLWIYLKLFSRKHKNVDKLPGTFEPHVTLVVAAFNEAGILDEKIRNCFELDYPEEKLSVIFIADGSSDGSDKVIGRYDRIQLLYQPQREGKVAAINRAMHFVKTDFVVFCDANTSLNKEAIRMIVRHYSDGTIGAVAGEKKVADKGGAGAASAGEGLYWRYESSLKKLDAAFYTVVGAAGELFSIRTALYEPVQTNVLLDDFIISLKICRRGYRVMYEPAAFASEAPSFSIKEEQKRKIRISAGGFQSVVMLKDLLNIFKYGKLSFQYISHRVLRWIVCPVMLPLIFISNAWLLFYNAGILYRAIFIMQVLFYAAALAGGIFANRNIKIKALYVPYYFVFMNIALYIGFSRYLKNQQSVLWDKAVRKTT